MMNRARRFLRRAVFGSESFPQQCAIGSHEPQAEVLVQLHGIGAPRDVTCCNVMAAAKPFTIGIGLGREEDASVIQRSRPSLQFQERGGEHKLLGKIGLRLREIISADTDRLGLFEVRYCRNYCLPGARFWVHCLYSVYKQSLSSRRSKAHKIRMTALGVQSLAVFYICPRPVVLVSVLDESTANIFPMDLIGNIGARHFSLALHNGSAGVPLIERSRRIALGSIPVEQLPVAYTLGQNHKKPGINLDQLPFTTAPSPAFGIPVPQFSLRVREMQIDAVRTLESHKLFLATILNDDRRAEGRQLFFVHGFYQAWKQRNRGIIGNLCPATIVRNSRALLRQKE
jgi:flavin reductase (DIM6/NTAB) family NADH-FMN oxidoreductase RutF